MSFLVTPPDAGKAESLCKGGANNDGMVFTMIVDSLYATTIQ